MTSKTHSGMNDKFNYFELTHINVCLSKANISLISLLRRSYYWIAHFHVCTLNHASSKTCRDVLSH